MMISLTVSADSMVTASQAAVALAHAQGYAKVRLINVRLLADRSFVATLQVSQK